MANDPKFDKWNFMLKRLKTINLSSDCIFY